VVAGLGIFDWVALGFILAGFVLGSRKGFSHEMMFLLQWLAIVVACGMGYKAPGGAFAAWIKINPSIGYVLAYVVIAIGVCVVFKVIRKLTGEKLFTKETFGRLETPLGALAGAGRFGCILVAGMAMINAFPMPAEGSKAPRPRAEWWAPDFETIQTSILAKSRTGGLVTSNLYAVLIPPTAPVKYEQKKIEGYGKRMERAAEEALDDKKK
jgi:uncharacterized membrane protein required for colicin V production